MENVCEYRKELFCLGQIVATPGAIAALEHSGQQARTFLDRHVHGDWGELDQHDKNENDKALRTGARLLSAYRLSDGTRLWIITEAGRHATTLLLPEEY